MHTKSFWENCSARKHVSEFILPAPKPSPQHSFHKCAVLEYFFFLRNWRELVCGWAYNGATSMGSYHYHYQISSYVLTHGPVVISRLDDHPPPNTNTHTHTFTHFPTIHVCTLHRNTNITLLPLVTACALAPARQRPSSLWH